MPYKDKAKQRKAQAESRRRRYHAPGSTMREYQVGFIRKARAQERERLIKAREVAARLLAKATEAARAVIHQRETRGYDGPLTPKGF